MISELASAVVLIYLVLAFYNLFEGVDRRLAVLVVILGGIMPALLNFVNVVSDAGALTIAQAPDFLSAFSAPQRDALVVLMLRLHRHQDTSAEILWGLWLFPLGLLVYRSRFLPRWIGVWLLVNGIAYVTLSLISWLLPRYGSQAFLLSQPALFGELVLILWLVIKGAGVPQPSITPFAVASAEVA